MRTLLALLRFVKLHLICRLFGHRITRERQEHLLYTGCGRCRQLVSIDLLKFTRKRDVTFGDLEHRMAAEPPEGYSFMSCNWKKRKAKFMSARGKLRFVNF
jgi:hypothetical protein